MSKTAASNHMDFIQFYKTAPKQQIDVHDFKLLAFQRKALIQRLAELHSTWEYEKNRARVDNATSGSSNNRDNSTAAYNPVAFSEAENNYTIAVRKLLNSAQATMTPMSDNIAHFALLVAAASSSDKDHLDALKQSLIHDEQLLFSSRLRLLTPQEIVTVIQSTDLPVKRYFPTPGVAALLSKPRPMAGLKTANTTKQGDAAIDERTVAALDHIWANSGSQRSGSLTAATLRDTPFYIMDFHEAFRYHLNKDGLVIADGKAFVSEKSAHTILKAHFGHMMQIKWRAVVDNAPHIAAYHQDLMKHALDAIRRGEYGDEVHKVDETANVGAKLTLDNLPTLVQTSFPLCHQRVYHHTLREHHAKNDARLQLTLFFKSAGLPVDDAVTWWRNAFAAKTPGDKFDKEYRYGFRHPYGEEGKGGTYSAQGCSTLMDKEPTQDQAFGCPFKSVALSKPEEFKNSILRALSHVEDMPADKKQICVDHIVDLCAKGHHQIACTQLFKFTHGQVEPSHNISHPMMYFTQSRRYYSEQEAEKQKQKEEDVMG